MKFQWKRNAVVATVLLFVCAAVYLNWRYAGGLADTQDPDTPGTTVQDTDGAGGGRVLGDASLVGGVPTVKPEDGEGETGQSLESSYFDTARLSRQQSRDNALSLLREAAAQENAEQASIDEANRAIQTLAGYAMLEGQVENLVMAKGYVDCVAFMGANSVSVVVDPGNGAQLQAEDVARIMDVVLSETDYTSEQIKILQAQ